MNLERDDNRGDCSSEMEIVRVWFLTRLK